MSLGPLYVFLGEVSVRKKELIPFETAWMELESIMLSEISQAVRDKYHMSTPLFFFDIFIMLLNADITYTILLHLEMCFSSQLLVLKMLIVTY